MITESVFITLGIAMLALCYVLWNYTWMEYEPTTDGKGLRVSIKDRFDAVLAAGGPYVVYPKRMYPPIVAAAACLDAGTVPVMIFNDGARGVVDVGVPGCGPVFLAIDSSTSSKKLVKKSSDLQTMLDYVLTCCSPL